jgi:hypothetical protein
LTGPDTDGRSDLINEGNPLTEIENYLQRKNDLQNIRIPDGTGSPDESGDPTNRKLFLEFMLF